MAGNGETVKRLRTALLLTACAFASGCSTLERELGDRLARSVELAVETDRRCTVVADALAGARSGEGLLQAVQARLTGSAACKPAEPAACGGELLLGSLRESGERVRREAQAAMAPLQSLGPPYPGAQEAAVLRQRVEAWADPQRWHKFEQETRADLEQIRQVTATSLRNADAKQACSTRVECTQFLARRLFAVQDQVARTLLSIRRRAAALEAELESDRAGVQAAWQALEAAVRPGGPVTGAVQQATGHARSALEAAGAAVRSAGAIQAQVRASEHALQALMGGDVERAAADFLGTHVFGAAARRALNLVERSLQPVDQAVERIDQRAFGLLTASVVVLDSDIRERMDDVYKVLDSRVLRTPALKLAFAGAACERLQAGSQQDRPSLLFPIFLDVFTRYMPEGGAGPAAAGVPARDKALRDTPDAVDTRIRTMALPSSAVSRAPSVVEVCASAEFAVRERLQGTSRSEGEVREIARQVCGQVVGDDRTELAPPPMALMAQGLAAPGVDTEAASSIRARTSALVATELRAQLDRVVPEPQLPTVRPVEVTREVIREIVRENVREPALPPPPVSASPGLCVALQPGLWGARCLDTGTGARVQFDATFARGAHSSPGLERALAALAETLQQLAPERQPQVAVTGHASSSSVRGDGEGSCVRPTAEAAKRDEQLAIRRAVWAASVIGSRYRQAPIESRGQPPGSAIPCDSALDRRVTVTLTLPPAKAAAPGPQTASGR